jgi:hypothetical protein
MLVVVPSNIILMIAALVICVQKRARNICHTGFSVNNNQILHDVDWILLHHSFHESQRESEIRGGVG